MIFEGHGQLPMTLYKAGFKFILFFFSILIWALVVIFRLVFVGEAVAICERS